jgi:hypothetical protein
LTLLFETGKTCGSPEAVDALREAGQSADELLERHCSGDWGDIDAQQARVNTLSVKRTDADICSSYTLPGDVRLRVTTHWDRSLTTITIEKEVE